jgi:hypothetical protein
VSWNTAVARAAALAGEASSSVEIESALALLLERRVITRLGNLLVALATLPESTRVMVARSGLRREVVGAHLAAASERE